MVKKHRFERTNTFFCLLNFNSYNIYQIYQCQFIASDINVGSVLFIHAYPGMVSYTDTELAMIAIFLNKELKKRKAIEAVLLYSEN